MSLADPPPCRSATRGYYGDRTAQADRAEQRTALVSTALKRTEMAATRIRMARPDPDRVVTLPREEAIVLTLARAPFHRELTCPATGGRSDATVPAGSLSFCDLREANQLRLRTAVDAVEFYVPLAALACVTEPVGRGMDRFSLGNGDIVDDPVLTQLSDALAAAFAKPEEASQLFIDHMARAVAAHIGHTYAGLTPGPAVARGGLAPWQEKRVRDLVEANLDGDVSIDQLAAECRLSTRHMSRAFRQTMGMPPHRWLLQVRVERAKAHLRERDLGLSDVARLCGFADQSHFTRIFTQLAGVSPGNWRRQTHRGPMVVCAA